MLVCLILEHLKHSNFLQGQPLTHQATAVNSRSHQVPLKYHPELKAYIPALTTIVTKLEFKVLPSCKPLQRSPLAAAVSCHLFTFI